MTYYSSEAFATTEDRDLFIVSYYSEDCDVDAMYRHMSNARRALGI